MNHIIDLSNYHVNIISDTINSIWFGEYSNSDRSEFICTINADLKELLDMGFNNIKLITAVDCGSEIKAKVVLHSLQKLGFSTIPQIKERKLDSSRYIYILESHTNKIV